MLNHPQIHSVIFGIVVSHIIFLLFIWEAMAYFMVL